MTALCARWRRALAGACAAAALMSLAACSSDDGERVAAPAPLVERELDSYDAFVLASDENNPLFADVYGLRFEPLVAERVTTMKRISSMGADVDHVVVSAADRDVDRLAVVNGDGTLAPVPGLGRPYAFTRPFTTVSSTTTSHVAHRM
ncbi:MAG: hypothetical protein ACT4PP_03170 [Sporichthyaceae bacterium]